MKLLVRSLGRSTTEATLKDLFEAFGAVQSYVLVMDAKTDRNFQRVWLR
jgi:RNA recognition motif-containing protein